MNRLSAILGPDGAPYKNGNGSATAHRNGHSPSKAQLKAFIDQANSFIEAIGLIGAPALVRAQDPFSNNPWVFTSAMMVAIAGSSSPLKIWREGAAAVDARRMETLAKGRPWQGCRAGVNRRAAERRLHKAIESRFFWRSAGIEEDYEHPLHEILIKRPNEHQNGKQFDQFVKLWLATRFECFAVKGDKDGNRLKLDTDPVESLWPYGPDHFEPILKYITYGRQVGWWFTPPKWGPHANASSVKIPLRMGEVIQFKFPNPNNPLRGMARTTAVAAQIELDELAGAQRRNLLKRGATPKGIMTYEGAGLSEEEAQGKKKSFEEEYGGVDNAGSTLFLHGGWKWQQAGFTPQQLQDKETLEWNRDTELAAMGTSLSALGISSADTYAAELIHDKGLWTKTIIPINQVQEDAIEEGLFQGETDNVFPGYDYKDVEALRAGLEHKVNIADKACGQNLHMTPRVAIDLVNLEVPKYPGDDKAFVSGVLSTGEDVAAGIPEPTALPPGADPKEPKPPVGPDQETPSTPADGNPPDNAAEAAKLRTPAGIVRVSRDERIIRARRRWADFAKVEFALEKTMKEAFRGWVAEQRRGILARFDDATRGKSADIDLTQILPNPDDARRALRKRTRPVHGQALEATWDLTQEEIGVPSFDMGDDRIVGFFDRRERRFLDSTTGTLIKRVRTAIENGVTAEPAETIQEIRMRVSSALDIEAGSSRGLTVARTEVAGFMNGTRDEMFGAEGFEEFDWSTAGDPNVRDSHVTFGNAGTKPRGFNWLTLVGEAGILLFPGDMQGPASETVNCRCLHVPGESKPGKSADNVRTTIRAISRRFDEKLAALEASRLSLISKESSNGH